MRHEKAWAPLLVLVLLCGCTASRDGAPRAELKPFTVPAQSIPLIHEIRLRWQIRDDAREYCRQHLLQTSPAGAAASPAPLACAIWNEEAKECSIVTEATTSHVIMGHELHHCFFGHFHKR